MKRKITFFIVSFMLVLQGAALYAQNYTQRKEFRMANSHWFARGPYCKMFDMRTNPPTGTEIREVWTWVGESGSGVSDTATGDLLFYSNGVQINNRNHEIMPNGDSIVPMSVDRSNYTSTTEQICIVPMIDSPGKFHVFLLLSGEVKAQGEYGLYYCVVDMNLENGLGDVVRSSITHLYDKPMAEGMAAVPGNNCDVWVLVHPSVDSNFMAYHITSAGLDKTPVISSPGSVMYGTNAFEWGGIAVSPQRDKIAIASYSAYSCEIIQTDTSITAVGADTSLGGVMVAKFDAETGRVSEGIKVNHYTITQELAFSPSGNMLYFVSAVLDTGFIPVNETVLLQYDLSKYSQNDIMASRYEVSRLTLPMYGLRIFGDTIMLSDHSYIAAPDSPQALCDYDITRNYFTPHVPTISISFGTNAVYPLPSTHIVNVKDTTVCSDLALSATSGYHHYRWNTGAEGAVLTTNGSGTYWVEYEKNCHTGVDTFHVQVVDFTEPVIAVNNKDLSTTESYETYQWMLDGVSIPGATASVYTVKVNGAYQVIVSKGECIDTSAPYQVNNATHVNDLGDKMSVQIYPNPASMIINIESHLPVEVAVIGVEGKQHKQIKNAKQVVISDLADGLYLIEIRNVEGRRLKIEKLVKSTVH